MADLVTNIQTDARVWADDSNLVITSGSGLRVFNMVYQGMCSPDYRLMGMKVGRRWPEATREDTSITMVAGTEQYTWPATPDFKLPFFIEGLDVNASNDPYEITPAISMGDWSALDDSSNAQPIHYRLIDVSGVVKLALRPNPDQADPVRITGIIEVTAFTAATAIDGTTKTVFLNVNSDSALAMLVAAVFKSRRGDPGRASELVQQAVGLLPMYDQSPTLRSGGFIQPWCV